MCRRATLRHPTLLADPNFSIVALCAFAPHRSPEGAVVDFRPTPGLMAQIGHPSAP
jgi:hypothetical protein